MEPLLDQLQIEALEPSDVLVFDYIPTISSESTDIYEFLFKIPKKSLTTAEQKQISELQRVYFRIVQVNSDYLILFPEVPYLQNHLIQNIITRYLICNQEKVYLINPLNQIEAKGGWVIKYIKPASCIFWELMPRIVHDGDYIHTRYEFKITPKSQNLWKKIYGTNIDILNDSDIWNLVGYFANQEYFTQENTVTGVLFGQVFNNTLRLFKPLYNSNDVTQKPLTFQIKNRKIEFLNNYLQNVKFTTPFYKGTPI